MMSLIYKRINLQILLTSLAFVVLAFVFAKAASAAELNMSPASQNVKAGEDLVVKIMLEAQPDQVIDGADAVITYDANKLKTKEVKSGTAFANIVTKERKGRLQISGLASTKGTTFTLSDTIATVTFEVLESGLTSLNFEFTEGQTTDSNVVLHGEVKDILVAVNGGQYSVQATSRNQFFSMLRRFLPILFIVLIFLIVAVGVIWYFRSRRQSDGDVFYPTPVPLDQAPSGTEGLIGGGEDPATAVASEPNTPGPFTPEPPSNPPMMEGS